MKWIFFDLDDTLWNFSDNSIEALYKLYELSPLLRKLFKAEEEFIKIYHENNALLWDLYAQGQVTTKQLKTERWRRTLALRQFEVLTADCERLDETYLDILAQGERKISGIDTLLEKLTTKCLIAILSNGFSKTQYKKLHFSGLEKFITRTIVSEEIGVNKPGKKIFDYAIRETGATSPFLMVGDHPTTDILGAMKAGWHAIWFNPKGKSFPLSEPDLRENGVNPKLLLANVATVEELGKAIFKFLEMEQN
ncbi:MAG: YjjG family noncanonical pyrimidine nucleotidase [Muribaculaceae bacterium]|nr:YjjG family noncanonical pyrimidine nucleotidase [Muribaculaceae bacterium]